MYDIIGVILCAALGGTAIYFLAKAIHEDIVDELNETDYDIIDYLDDIL